MELDLSEATAAAAAAICWMNDDPPYGRHCENHGGTGVEDADACDIGLDRILPIIEAAAPIIERQVRERVAEDIAAALAKLSPEVTSNQRQGFYRSIAIARGEQ